MKQTLLTSLFCIVNAACGIGIGWHIRDRPERMAGDHVPAKPSHLERVEFDGHLWITSTYGGYRWQPVHHPDCPCHSAKGELLPEKP